MGVVVPANDEEELLPRSLSALGRAMDAVSVLGVDVGVAIVLDRCRDASAAICHRWRTRRREQVQIVDIDAGCVGSARSAGADRLLRTHPDLRWLSTTDADSCVPPDWLVHQMQVHQRGVALWSGSVAVADWGERTAGLSHRWNQAYSAEARPVHGASMGMTPTVYRAAGGFRHAPTGEDRDLFLRVESLGAEVHHCRCVPVVTSSRRQARAPEGFAHALSLLEQ